jgi:predicted ATPase
MKLKRFRVQMYKCVLDSGWIDVTSLTVLVGKNEAGKTSLLRALHKFNPFEPEPYSIPREWPRGHRGERSDSQVVCSTEFELAEQELRDLKKITTEQVQVQNLVITRDYAGRFEVLFPEGLFPQSLHPDDVTSFCNALPLPQAEVDPEFQTAAVECREEAIRMAHEGRFTDMESLLSVHETKLAHRSPHNPHQVHENNFRAQYLAQLRDLARQLQEAPSIHAKARACVLAALPTFVYMDEYRTFRGTASLEQVKERKEQGKATADDQTLMTILALAGLDLDQEVKKAAQQDREERQYDLNDAAATLNRKIENHWKQLRYEVDFRADGPQFMTFVKGIRDRGLIRLEERSRGFQWFFSFDLMLMHETRGTFKNCVILMDEPGLHLHPSAQLDLLDILATYARENTLIYTTHLPFMIDLRFPERIRVISETDQGTVASQTFTESDPEAKLVLQSALGMGALTSYLVAEQNLVVPGVDDYWILTALSDLFHRSIKSGLPPDLLLTPAGGPSEVTYISTFMVAQGLKVVALYDSDPAGDAAKAKFLNNWLAGSKGRKASAVSFADAIKAPGKEFSIEDLFTELFYTSCVETVYSKQLAAQGLDLKVVPKGEQLAKRIESVFQNAALPFNKDSVAKVVSAKIRSMKTISELPESTRKAVETLFEFINNEFASFPPS